MEKSKINSSKAPAPIGPYSQAIMVNGFLFVSGQIAIDPEENKVISDDISSETHQVMKNLKAILNAGEMSFANVVKCSIFIKDMNNFTLINEAYGQYFDETPPARETVEVSRLPKDVNVEISCIAAK